WDFAVARYNADGSLDTTFGSGGTVTTNFGPGATYDDADGVAIQSDGKIVVAGTCNRGGSDNVFAVARYNADGSLDSTFGSGGTVTTDFGLGGSDDSAYAVALQPDGKIVAAGATYLGGVPGDFALARYNPDGTLDSTFGGG